MENKEMMHWESKNTMSYHEKQFFEPKRSTIAFDQFLSNHTKMEGSVLDLACGGGAVDDYLVRKHPNLYVTGVDIVDHSFKFFNMYASKEAKERVKLIKDDLFSFQNTYEGYDGIILVQTLSWLSEWKKPLEVVTGLNPKWIAMSSLFYKGKIEFQVKILDYIRADASGKCDEALYNIYSLPIIRDFLYSKGYKLFIAEPFEIDIDLEKPKNLDMGTYTIKTEGGGRMQASGALLMPWYFIYAERND